LNRFAARLAYPGYSSFRAHWQQQLQASMEPLDKLQQQRTAPAAHQQRLHEALLAGSAQVQAAAALLAPDTIDAIAALLAQARRIAVLGCDVSAYLAGYGVSYASLFHSDVQAISSLGGASEAQRRVMALTPQDVLLALSLPRYSILTVELCAQASEQGVPVIVLADSPTSPVIAHARHALIAPAQHPMLPASALGLVGLIECLCMLLAAANLRTHEQLLCMTQGTARFHTDALPRATRAARKRRS